MAQFVSMSMPRGFAGEITRGSYDFTTESHQNDGSIKAFGVPVKLTENGVGACTAAGDEVYGIAVRVYGQVDAAGVQFPRVVTVLRRGYVAVNVKGKPETGKPVNLAANGEFTADAGTKIPGATFMGEKSADVAEIAFNI